MLKLLAFDYGASNGRAMLGLFDGNKITLEQVHRFPNEPVMVNGILYWDVLRLFYEMKLGLLKAMQKCENDDLTGIGVDTWGVDFGLLDAKGSLLSNPVHYRDARTENMIEEACKIVPRREIYEQTGIQFMKFNTLYQLLAMRLENSPILEKAETMLLMPDLFNYFLTGEKLSEYTISSTTQMMNPRTGNWAYDLLKKMGIPYRMLTNIIDAGTVIGKVNKSIKDELGLGDIPVIAVAEHDTASAVMSVPATDDKFAYLSSGTWSLLGVELPHPIINETTYALDYTNEGGYNRTTRLLKNIAGLWIHQECRRAWEKAGEVFTYDELEQMAEDYGKPFTAFIDPDDDLFYSPGNMPERVVEFCKKTGQNLPNEKGAIVRCVLESLALKYKKAVLGLEEIVGYKIPVLHVVGGGSRNTVLCKYTANALGKKVIAGPTEATALGNIICQLMALGEISDINEARNVIRESFPTDVYMPENEDLWQEAYLKFKKIIEMNI
mgnify:CR=1 FL=1